MRRAETGDLLLTQLMDAEKAIDEALISVGALMVSLPRVRLEHDYSVVLGAPAFSALSQSIAGLTESRRAIVETHAALAEAAPHIGLRHMATGTGQPKPDDKQRPPEGALRRVA